MKLDITKAIWYNRIMNIKTAEAKAKEMISQFGLDDYNFQFDEAVERFGSCSWDKKTITLSRKLTELNTEEAVRSTILHEIAHALTPKQGHNEIWQRVAKAIGYDGHRCYDEETTKTPLAKWTAVCPNCKKEIQRNTRRKGLACAICCKITGRYSKQYKFKWTKNI